jgi:hypothetical protein
MSVLLVTFRSANPLQGNEQKKRETSGAAYGAVTILDSGPGTASEVNLGSYRGSMEFRRLSGQHRTRFTT